MFILIHNWPCFKWELAGQPCTLWKLDSPRVSGMWSGLDSLYCGSTVSVGLQQAFPALAGSCLSTYWKMKHILTHRRHFSRQSPFKLFLGMKQMVKGDWWISRNSQTFRIHLSLLGNLRKGAHFKVPASQMQNIISRAQTLHLKIDLIF